MDFLKKTAMNPIEIRSAPFSQEELSEARKEAKAIIDKYDRFIVLGFKPAEDPQEVYTKVYSCCKVRDLGTGRGALKKEEQEQLKKKIANS